MFSTFLVDKEGRRVSTGSFRVDSHHDACAAAKKKHDRLFRKFQTGQWRLITKNENTGKEEEFPTI